MNKLLIICGPTATGKTKLGVDLAKKFNGEIISADSRQVYRGMDIVTGKDLPEDSKLENQNSKLNINNEKLSVGFREKDGIPVWLVDIVEPDYPFNFAQYSFLAHKVVNNIWQRGKLPIVVGGTGLYIKSIIDPIPTAVIPPNKILRKQLENQPKEVLQQKLIEIDRKRWENMNQPDRNNPRRLIRAIEVAKWEELNKDKFYPPPTSTIDSILFVGLKAAMKSLFKIIDRRVEERVNSGAIEEVKELVKRQYSWFLPALSATGCRKLKEYLEGKDTRAGALRGWKLQESQLVRKQMVWFKKDKRIKWFDITEEGFPNNLISFVEKWYTSN